MYKFLLIGYYTFGKAPLMVDRHKASFYTQRRIRIGTSVPLAGFEPMIAAVPRPCTPQTPSASFLVRVTCMPAAKRDRIYN